MIIKTQIILLAILCIFTFASCIYKSDIRLENANKNIESNPTKSLNILSTINCDNLSKNDFALYSLLYTQALIKCGVAVSSDSLIRFAYKFYKESNNEDLYIRSFFYNAKVSYNKNDLCRAMNDALVAYDCAKEHNEYYWIAKSAELISDIFFDVYNYSQAEIFTKEAIENYKLSNKCSNLYYALCDLATIYLNENKDTEAAGLLDSIKNVCPIEFSSDQNFSDYLKATTNALKLKTGKLQDIQKDDFSTSNKDYSNDEIIDNLLINSYLYRSEGNFSKSKDFISNAKILASDEQQHARILFASFEHAKAIGDFQYAVILADSILFIQSDIAENILKETITGVQRDFYSNKAQINERKSKYFSIILMIVIPISIIIIALLLIIYRLRLKSKESKLEAAMDTLLILKEKSNNYDSQVKLLSNNITEQSNTISILQKELEYNQEDKIQNEKIIEYLFKEKWSTLNMLCDEYFELGKSVNTRNSILHRIEVELEKLRSPKSLKQFEDMVNSYRGDIMSKLRKECPFLKEADFTFLSLVFAGFSVRAVCLFTDIKYKLFYLKKSRITKKIASSDAPHKELFLEKLS